jgi:hypothetical protein
MRVLIKTIALVIGGLLVALFLLVAYFAWQDSQDVDGSVPSYVEKYVNEHKWSAPVSGDTSALDFLIF